MKRKCKRQSYLLRAAQIDFGEVAFSEVKKIVQKESGESNRLGLMRK